MAFPDQVVIKLETNMAEELEPQWREQEECSVIPYQQSENTVSSTITSRSRNTWRWKPSNIVMKSEADCWTDNGQGIEAEPTDHCDTGNTSHLLQSQGRRKEKVNIKCEPYWDTDIDEPSGDKQKQDKEAESWSVKEEPQDPPSAVCSMTLSMSDNISRSSLSLTRNHECQCCFATFVLVSSLELHMASIHGEELHVVLPASPTPDNCEADNYSSGCMETVSWPECRKTAEGMMDNNEIDKRTEIKNLHNNHKAFVCDVCSKAFTRACHLDKHKLVHSNSGHRPCVCDECNKAFTRVSDLNKHKLVHTSQKTFACDMCSKAFSQAGNLKRHKLIHTGHKPYACNVCHKAFFDSSYLKRHKLIHTDHKPFSCDVCNKGFNNTTSLKVHKRIHTGERPYKCPHCDSHFYSSSDRHTHIKTVHDGIRPHVCDVCAAAFSSTSNLKKHRKTHTGEKPHKCTDCGKGFIQLCNLKKHRLVHTGEKPYTCPLCPNAFIWPESLKKHMRKTHQ